MSNRKSKLQLYNLLVDFFTSGEIATGKVLFVTKEKIVTFNAQIKYAKFVHYFTQNIKKQIIE